MFKKKETSVLYDRFFSGDVKIKETYDIEGPTVSTEATVYTLESGNYTFKIMIFNTGSSGMFTQAELRKEGNIVPLENYEFKMFAKECVSFIRK